MESEYGFLEFLVERWGRRGGSGGLWMGRAGTYLFSGSSEGGISDGLHGEAFSKRPFLEE